MGDTKAALFSHLMTAFRRASARATAVPDAVAGRALRAALAATLSTPPPAAVLFA